MANTAGFGFNRSQTIDSFKMKSRGKKEIVDLLDAEDIVKRMRLNHANRRITKTDMYESLPLFKDIDAKRDRDSLKSALVEERYKAGEVIFHYKDVGDKFFIVLSGEVMIELPDPEIPKDEFFLRYTEYKLLVDELEGRKELKRKMKLVEERKA